MKRINKVKALSCRSSSYLKVSSAGFTLIELMVVLGIIAILAAIAVPSYRQYVVTNAERDVQAKMLQLQIQLERWRASALTYKGFMPKVVGSDSSESYTYDKDNKIIYFPQGSNATNYRYQITLVDGVDTSSSLVPADNTSIDNTTGRSWKMLAEPNNVGVTKNANYFMLSSTGLKCQNISKVAIEDADCGTNQKGW